MMKERELRKASQTAPTTQLNPNASNSTKKSPLSIPLGLLSGAILGLLWLSICFFWNKSVAPFLVSLLSQSTSPKNWNGGAQIVVDIFPAFLGGIIYYMGISKLTEIFRRKSLSGTSFSKSAASTAILCAIAYSAFMFLVAYSYSGVSSFYSAAYGALIMICTITGAREAVKQHAA